ncbi:hypothetical protein IGI04_015283 [Brassica rapa subsp. trilocularis]|uniref:Thioredoxin domain-containing protein n=1 Tax=Brassica rapa subsp. trilocularis TaxID=1813537 RepID=A0ABQ7MS53_BRACM|nr:hypothetical protein IGI04_015283 [Brassica rapa subsp. trilocularis]
MRKQEPEEANRNVNMETATSDQSLITILDDIKSSKLPAVINYGASWCGVCNQTFPAFQELSNSFKRIKFVYADIDECPENTLHIRYTPTFQFYRDGEKVDEMFGAGEERLQDRLWLLS